jgi:hypothetical protein
MSSLKVSTLARTKSWLTGMGSSSARFRTSMQSAFRAALMAARGGGSARRDFPATPGRNARQGTKDGPGTLAPARDTTWSARVVPGQ